MTKTLKGRLASSPPPPAVAHRAFPLSSFRIARHPAGVNSLGSRPRLLPTQADGGVGAGISHHWTVETMTFTVNKKSKASSCELESSPRRTVLGPLWLTKTLPLRGVLGRSHCRVQPPQPPPPGLVTDPRLALGLSVISRARDLLRHPAGGSHDRPPSGLDRGCRGGQKGVQCGR